MPVTHKNRLRTTISNTPGGAGALTISTASSGYRTFAAGDDGLTFDVVITDGTAWEVRTDCTYTHSGTSLSRGTLEDSSTGSAITLTSAAVVTVTASAGWGKRVLHGAKSIFRVAAHKIASADESGNTTQAILANNLYAQSFLLAAPATISGMEISVTTGSAGNLRMGIYDIEADGTASLIAEIASAIDTTSTGDKSAAFAANVTLNAGYYVVMYVGNSTPTFRANNTSPLGVLRGNFNNSGLGAYREALTYPSGMPSTVNPSAWNVALYLASKPRILLTGV
jgi:hypothetical protein